MGNSAKKFIEKINEVLAEKENAVVNIINDKLTISVFTALEKNLKNVKEINFIFFVVNKYYSYNFYIFSFL